MYRTIWLSKWLTPEISPLQVFIFQSRLVGAVHVWSTLVRIDTFDSLMLVILLTVNKCRMYSIAYAIAYWVSHVWLRKSCFILFHRRYGSLYDTDGTLRPVQTSGLTVPVCLCVGRSKRSPTGECEVSQWVPRLTESPDERQAGGCVCVWREEPGRSVIPGAQTGKLTLIHVKQKSFMTVWWNRNDDPVLCTRYTVTSRQDDAICVRVIQGGLLDQIWDLSIAVASTFVLLLM